MILVEPATAALTSASLDLTGDVLVELQQQRVEPGVEQQFVAQGRPPFTSP